jgi:hypothetical protein
MDQQICSPSSRARNIADVVYAASCFLVWLAFVRSSHRIVADIIAFVCVGEQLRNAVLRYLARRQQAERPSGENQR